MSWAVCKKCSYVYHWRAQRGMRLADWNCPKCGGEGRAAKHEETASIHGYLEKRS